MPLSKEEIEEKISRIPNSFDQICYLLGIASRIERKCFSLVLVCVNLLEKSQESLESA